MTSPAELAKAAVARKELEMDRPVHDAWEPMLRLAIGQARSLKLDHARDVMLSFRQSHPEKMGQFITVGEMFRMFGLAESATEGVIWND